MNTQDIANANTQTATHSTHAERMLSLVERNRILREQLEFAKRDNELDILVARVARHFASE